MEVLRPRARPRFQPAARITSSLCIFLAEAPGIRVQGPAGSHHALSEFLQPLA